MRHLVPCLLLLWLPPALAEAQESCLECHTSREKLESSRVDAAAPVDRLLIDRERYAASVHASRSCGDCHFEFETRPHPKGAETATCGECHEEAQRVFAESVHGKAKEPVSCAACHGVHDARKASDRSAPLHPLNIHLTCGKCHFASDPSAMTPEQMLRDPHSDDTHAHGILKSGLVVSATCVSCHGGHEIRGKGDPASKVARERVHETCGACHVGVLEQYKKSVHHLRSNGPEHKGATCTDCHVPHDIERAGRDTRFRSAERCAQCHEERSGSYRQTYHGKVAHLGLATEVATCASCHGAHAILPSSDPASTIHPDRRVATCAQCHEDAHASFASYAIHADPRDGGAHPGLHFIYRAMWWLLVVTFGATGLHSILWLIRSLIAKEWRLARHAPGDRLVRRWRPFYTYLHVAIMTAFLLLASTGLPLHYSDRPWASGLMAFFGGPASGALVHRTAALLMIVSVASYLGHIAWRALVRREPGLWSGPNTMLPRWRDLRDCAQHVRWFLGLGPKPRFDRWTYWEKFDFWAVFWGIAVIGGSGVILWLPEAATRVLPGWAINVAVVIHGHEALLAVGFIFSIHIFNTQLRPEKFPMDTLFYTGVIPEEEFRRERPEEYERAVREGTLASLAASPPTRTSRLRAHLLGAAALAVGLWLVVMMLAA